MIIENSQTALPEVISDRLTDSTMALLSWIKNVESITIQPYTFGLKRFTLTDYCSSNFIYFTKRESLPRVTIDTSAIESICRVVEHHESPEYTVQPGKSKWRIIGFGTKDCYVTPNVRIIEYLKIRTISGKEYIILEESLKKYL